MTKPNAGFQPSSQPSSTVTTTPTMAIVVYWRLR
jgi:hypothetical protein